MFALFSSLMRFLIVSIIFFKDMIDIELAGVNACFFLSIKANVGGLKNMVRLN